MEPAHAMHRTPHPQSTWVKPAMAAVLACCVAGPAAAAFFVYPSEPRAGQDLVLWTDSATDCSVGTGHAAQATVGDGTITLAYPTALTCGVALPAQWVSAIVNVPKPGTYAVSALTNANTANAQARPIGQVTVLPAVGAARTGVPLGGLWLVPSEPGWGLSIAEGQSGQLFLTWYTYGGQALADGFGTSTWLFTSSGTWTTPTRFTGALVQPFGSFFTRTFDPSLTILQPVGSSTLDVTGPDTVTFTVHYNIGAGDSTSTYNLTRFKF